MHLAPDTAYGSRPRFGEASRFFGSSHFLDFVDLAPPRASTSTVAPLILPITAHPISEVTEIFPVFTSASGSPTTRHAFFSRRSPSTREAPNLMVSPKSFDTSIASARASLSSRHGELVHRFSLQSACEQRMVTPWEAGQCQSNRPLVQVSPHVGGSQSTSSERGGSLTTKSAMRKTRVATAYFCSPAALLHPARVMPAGRCHVRQI
jgi:hypothetical protein